MKRDRKAFTLIELLAVAFIIACTVAMLVACSKTEEEPKQESENGISLLVRARQRSQRMSCINNLKQLGAGLQLYLDGPGGQRFYPYPMEAAGVPPEEARPGKGFSGAAFLAALYWSDVISAPDVFICPGSDDDNRKGRDLGETPQYPDDNPPGYAPHFNQTGIHVSYASKAQWKMPFGRPMGQFQSNTIIAADSTHPLRDKQNHPDGAVALYGDKSVRFVEFPDDKTAQEMIGKQAPFDMIDN